MKKGTRKYIASPETTSIWSVLEEHMKQKAGEMLQYVLEAEVGDFIKRHESRLDEKGKRSVVRNGFMPERVLQTSVGPVKISQPRIDDRKMTGEDGYEHFQSSILPKFARRSPTLDVAIPVLYLKGISTGDIEGSLRALLGPNVDALSAQTVVRLKEKWEIDYREWMKRSLTAKNYVYIWADGIHMSVRMEDEKSCLLVVLGADEEGNKELLTVVDGFRESAESWKEVLRDLKNRGVEKVPKLAIGDGALGFWRALEDIFPPTKHQRCWVHKIRNVLDKTHRSVQGKAKGMLHEIVMAPSRAEAEKAFNRFASTFKDKYPKAVECLEKDRVELLTFYNFPAAHWESIRSTNPIESMFATVRLRTYKTRGMCSRATVLTMTYKLGIEAQKTFRKLNQPDRVKEVWIGKIFEDGELREAA